MIYYSNLHVDFVPLDCGWLIVSLSVQNAKRGAQLISAYCRYVVYHIAVIVYLEKVMPGFCDECSLGLLERCENYQKGSHSGSQKQKDFPSSSSGNSHLGYRQVCHLGTWTEVYLKIWTEVIWVLGWTLTQTDSSEWVVMSSHRESHSSCWMHSHSGSLQDLHLVCRQTFTFTGLGRFREGSSLG